MLEEYRKTYPNLTMELLERDTRLEYAMDLIINKPEGLEAERTKRRVLRYKNSFLMIFRETWKSGSKLERLSWKLISPIRQLGGF